MIIAIDGPAASGKGTLARRLATHYGLPHLDTGLLYRATAASLLQAERDLHDVEAAVAAARGLALTDFDDARLRGPKMGEAASVVAAIPEVRAALVQVQRDFAARPGGAVLDGRDIGTVICQDADVKIFVTATPSARAQRRALELAQRGERVDYSADSRRNRQAGHSRRPTLERAHARRGRRGVLGHHMPEHRRRIRGSGAHSRAPVSRGLGGVFASPPADVASGCASRTRASGADRGAGSFRLAHIRYSPSRL